MTATQSARILVTDPKELAEARALNARMHALADQHDADSLAARPVVAPPVVAVPPTLAGRAGGEKGAAA